jgi:hypothetical protein
MINMMEGVRDSMLSINKCKDIEINIEEWKNSEIPSVVSALTVPVKKTLLYTLHAVVNGTVCEEKDKTLELNHFTDKENCISQYFHGELYDYLIHTGRLSDEQSEHRLMNRRLMAEKQYSEFIKACNYNSETIAENIRNETCDNRKLLLSVAMEERENSGAICYISHEVAQRARECMDAVIRECERCEIYVSADHSVPVEQSEILDGYIVAENYKVIRYETFESLFTDPEMSFTVHSYMHFTHEEKNTDDNCHYCIKGRERERESQISKICIPKNICSFCFSY